MNLVPTPCTVSTSTRPFSRSMDFSTTSSPTPRPETSVIASRVEKPWAKMSCTTSRSESASSPFSSPRATALACTRAASMPAPSSMIVITTWFDSWVAESRIVPVGVLPRATRSAGVSMPWSTLLRIRWTSGSPISSMIALSMRVFSPSRISSMSLPGLAGEVAHQAREALEDVADGEHPDVHHRLLQRGGDGRDLVHGGLQLAARVAAAELLRHLLAELLQLRAVDDQLAHQVQQVVELGEVDAHHVRAAGGVRRGVGRRRVAPGAAGRRRRRRRAPAGAGAAAGGGRPALLAARARGCPSSAAVSGARSRTSPWPWPACSTASRSAVAPAKRASKTSGVGRERAVA